MTAAEKGFLLLTSFLGDPRQRPLTMAQFRTLTQRMRAAAVQAEERDVAVPDLMDLGYRRDMAERIVALLQREELLQEYLRAGKRNGCFPVTRVSEDYPFALRKKLGSESPGCFWAKGEIQLLAGKCIALVGSRDIHERNREFAREVGIQAANQGLTLVSGNARGADSTAQEACLEHGGNVICIVADALQEKQIRENVLYLSEEGYDLSFSAGRALSRNRLIHALGEKTLVAQCDLHTGGTWSGTAKNLQAGWSPVFCFDDGSPAAGELAQMGAKLVNVQALSNLHELRNSICSFFDQ